MWRSGVFGWSQARPGRFRPLVNPNLEQAHTDETSLTLEQELVSDVSFRGLLIYKKVAGTYGNVKILRPYSAWNIPVTRRDPGPDGTTGNADDGALITFWDFDPRYRGAAFVPMSVPVDPPSTLMPLLPLPKSVVPSTPTPM